MRFRFPQTAVILGLIGLFLVANRAAYDGYFSDDDFENLVNNRFAAFDIFWRGFLSFQYDFYNFRPVGHVFFRWMGQWWGLQFTPYIILIQLFHLLNVFLVCRVTRSVLDVKAAAVAAIFFAFHPALLAAHWKPMYIFDLLCGMALMSAYYCYRQGWRIGSLILFWCAYKSKEIAICFPLVLLIEEWFGQRRWMRLAPFFAVSLSFGGQALIANHVRAGSAYTLQFSAAAVWQTLRFYSGGAWGLPWVMMAAWVWIRGTERRWMVMGTLSAALLLVPLLFLPGRLYAVYLYVPLMFGSIAVGAALGRCTMRVLVALLLAYLGFGFRELQAFRKVELAQADSTREFVEAACVALKGSQNLSKATYEGGPVGLNVWGVEGALRLCSGNLWLVLQPWDLKKIQKQEAVIRWTKRPGARGLVELSHFDGELSGEWYAWDGSLRWMGERARARVKVRPEDHRLVLDLQAAPADEIEVFVAGRSLGSRRLTEHGEQRLFFEVPTWGKEKNVEIELWARPARRIGNDARELGAAVRQIEATP